MEENFSRDAVHESTTDGGEAVAAEYNSPVPVTQYAVPVEKLVYEQDLKKAVEWIYTIAGLTLVNSIVWALGGDFYFFFALGSSFLLAVIGKLFESIGTIIALVINIILAGGTALIGYLTSRRMGWVLIFGMIAYVFDMLILGALAVFSGKDIGLLFIGVIVHIVALVPIFKGYKAITALNAMVKEQERIQQESEKYGGARIY